MNVMRLLVSRFKNMASVLNISSTKTKNNQKFSDNYTDKWPCMVRSRKGVHYALCTICQSDVSVRHSGQYDLKVHIDAPKHKDNVSAKEATPSMLNYVRREDASNGVIRAECIMSNFFVEHNMSLAIADHFSPLMSHMFPDSKIASC